jgi:hypothetical protein
MISDRLPCRTLYPMGPVRLRRHDTLHFTHLGCNTQIANKNVLLVICVLRSDQILARCNTQIKCNAPPLHWFQCYGQIDKIYKEYDSIFLYIFCQFDRNTQTKCNGGALHLICVLRLAKIWSERNTQITNKNFLLVMCVLHPVMFIIKIHPSLGIEPGVVPSWVKGCVPFQMTVCIANVWGPTRTAHVLTRWI